MRHLPRVVHVGRGYRLRVRVMPAKFFRDRYGENLAGTFEASLGKSPAGTLYIRANLSAEQRWVTYWHELMHALHDIACWDGHKLRT